MIAGRRAGGVRYGLLLVGSVLALLLVSSLARAAGGERIFLISHAGIGDPFWAVEFKGARDAAKQAGIRLTILAPERPNDVVRQLELLNTAISEQPDGIAVTIPDRHLFAKALRHARDQGIPVVAFNTRPKGDDTRMNAFYAAYIGMDDYLAGKAAARRALASGRVGTHAVVVIQQAGHVGLEARYRGIRDVLVQRKIVVDKLDSSSDSAVVRRVFGKYMSEHSGVTAVFTLGPACAHPIAGLLADVKNHPYMASFDISPLTLKYIRTGVIDFTIDQQPYMQGYLSVQMLVLAARFRMTPTDVNTGVGVIDASNVEEVASLVKARIR